MKFSRQQIGEKLKNELAKGYDIDRISNWAFELEDKIQDERDKEVSALLNCLCIMPGGLEYEYTEEELKTICELLLNEEKDPVKIIDQKRIEDKSKNAIKDRIYRLIVFYVTDVMSEYNFCRQFHCLYTVELESDTLTEDEERAFSELSHVTGRFSDCEEDFKSVPNFFYTKEEVSRKIIETYQKLLKFFEEWRKVQVRQSLRS